MGGNFTGPQTPRAPRDASDDDTHITCVYNFSVKTSKRPVKVTNLKMKVTVVAGPFCCEEQLAQYELLFLLFVMYSFNVGGPRAFGGICRLCTCGRVVEVCQH